MTANNHGALLQLVGGQRDFWNDFEAIFPSEKALAATALALGAEKLGALSSQESTLARGAARYPNLPTDPLPLISAVALGSIGSGSGWLPMRVLN